MKEKNIKNAKKKKKKAILHQMCKKWKLTQKYYLQQPKI